jgi:hypothetical protein
MNTFLFDGIVPGSYLHPGEERFERSPLFILLDHLSTPRPVAYVENSSQTLDVGHVGEDSSSLPRLDLDREFIGGHSTCDLHFAESSVAYLRNPDDLYFRMAVP